MRAEEVHVGSSAVPVRGSEAQIFSSALNDEQLA